jgi:hypothetical protein
MLKIIVVGIAGVALGVSAISYINYTNNQLMEDKYVYLQRDVKQLTKEISALNHKIEVQAAASSNQKSMSLTNIAKNNKATPSKYRSGLSTTERSLILAEQEKLTIQKKTRKKHLGNSMAAN